MSLALNNSKDITCDSLYLTYNNSLENILDVIASGGGTNNGLTTLTGTGSAIVSGTGISRNILVDLSLYSTTSAINTLLDGKIDNSQVLTNVIANA